LEMPSSKYPGAEHISMLKRNGIFRAHLIAATVVFGIGLQHFMNLGEKGLRLSPLRLENLSFSCGIGNCCHKRLSKMSPQ